MRHLAKCCAVVLLVALVGVALSPTHSAGQDGGGNPGVIPPQAKYRGLSYGEWGARQTQWFFSLPVDHHPLYDTADCSAGQSGNVWFLGGTFASSEIKPGVILGEADRDCTIPSGTALFFPLVSAECSEAEGNGTTEAELRDCSQLPRRFHRPVKCLPRDRRDAGHESGVVPSRIAALHVRSTAGEQRLASRRVRRASRHDQPVGQRRLLRDGQAAVGGHAHAPLRRCHRRDLDWRAGVHPGHHVYHHRRPARAILREARRWGVGSPHPAQGAPPSLAP